jgi:hypothetical protein
MIDVDMYPAPRDPITSFLATMQPVGLHFFGVLEVVGSAPTLAQTRQLFNMPVGLPCNKIARRTPVSPKLLPWKGVNHVIKGWPRTNLTPFLHQLPFSLPL